ncbi:hypothetical protein HPG69_010491, partial [Diceros bicornis minor]
WTHSYRRTCSGDLSCRHTTPERGAHETTASVETSTSSPSSVRHTPQTTSQMLPVPTSPDATV